MRRDRRTWWRILGGVFVAVLIGGNLVMHVLCRRSTFDLIVQLPPATLIVLDYDLPEGGRADPAQMAVDIEGVIGPHSVGVTGRGIEVRIPFETPEEMEAYRDRQLSLARLGAAGVDVAEFRGIMRRYIPPHEAAAFSSFPPTGPPASAGLATLTKAHPAQAALIAEAAASWQAWADESGPTRDGDDVARRLSVRTGLEFRIAPVLPGIGRPGVLALTESDYRKYVAQLEAEGPMAGHARNDTFLWFPVRSKTAQLSPHLVVAKHAARPHLLLCSGKGRTMVRRAGADGKPSWSLEAYPTSDQMGQPAIGFQFDARGAKQMGQLTGAHNDHYLVILVGDEVYSAPVIRAAIYERGVIEGNFTPREVRDLAVLLNISSRRGPPVRYRAVSQTLVGPVDPPRAEAKRTLLWAVAAAAGVLAGAWLWATATGRPHAAGLTACLLVAAAIGWWSAAAWQNPVVADVLPLFVAFNIVAGLCLGAVWFAAGATAATAPAGQYPRV